MASSSNERIQTKLITSQNTKHLKGVFNKYNSKPDYRKKIGQPNDAKSHIVAFSSLRHASMMIDCCTSHRCNWAQNRSQYVPLKRTCKRDFSLHLSRTSSFLISQIDNKKLLCLTKRSKSIITHSITGIK